MSTKIYTAYRTKRAVDLFELIRRIRALGEASVRAILAKLFLDMVDNVDTKS